MDAGAAGDAHRGAGGELERREGTGGGRRQGVASRGSVGGIIEHLGELGGAVDQAGGRAEVERSAERGSITQVAQGLEGAESEKGGHCRSTSIV